MSAAGRRLLGPILVRFGGAVVGLGGLFFGLAGTFDYWQAWLYLVTLLTPMALTLTYLLHRDPALLERRMRARESRGRQRTIVGLAVVVILLAFVIPGLDRRFGWSGLPRWVPILADAVILVSYGLFVLVLRVNSYAARTVEIEAEQRVVSDGPYRCVRHPMYVAVLAIYILSPVALGSAWGVLPALLLPPLIVARIRDEERMLARDLAGYRDYMTKTRFRLIPGVW